MSGQQPPTRRGTSRAILIGALAGVLALVLGLGGYLWFGRTHTTPTSGPAAATPTAAVRGYLDALVAGHAADALAYAAAKPVDTSLLSDQVLAASQKLRPLSVVNVGTVEGQGTAMVPVTVRQADTTKDWQVPVIQTPQGWRLSKVTSEITLGGLPSGLALTLNGQALPAGPTATVFPGAYAFADTVPEIDFKDKPLIVDAPGSVFNVELTPVLTDAGKKKLRTLAQAAVKNCLAQKSITPDGCPNVAAAAKGQTVIDKTVKWTLKGDPWKAATYSVSPEEPTKASGKSKFTFRLVCSLKQDGATYQIDQSIPYTMVFSADVIDPAATVSWQRV